MSTVTNQQSPQIVFPQPIRSMSIELLSEDSVLNPARVLELIQRPKTPSPVDLRCPPSWRFGRTLEPIIEGKENG